MHKRHLHKNNKNKSIKKYQILKFLQINNKEWVIKHPNKIKIEIINKNSYPIKCQYKNKTHSNKNRLL